MPTSPLDLDRSTARPFVFQTGAHGAGDFVVTAFRTRETLSRPYEVHVELATQVPLADLLSGVLGQRAALTMRNEEPERTIAGIVRDLRAIGVPTSSGHYSYALTLVPELALSSQRIDSRIFQLVRFDKVIEEVLDGLSLRWLLERHYPLREYLTQFRESDLRFVHRLLAEAGVFYRFDQPDAEKLDDAMAETLVLTDHVGGYGTVDDGRTAPTFILRETFGDHAIPHDELREVTMRERLRPAATTYRAYDFGRPNTELRARAGVMQGARPRELYAHSRGALVPDWERDQREASLMLDRAVRDQRVVEGIGTSPSFRVGRRFRLQDDLGGRHDGEYVIVSLRRHGVFEAGKKAPADVYRHRFTAVPASVCFRPKARAPRRISSCVGAKVVGPPGEEIFVDPLGRVKVQFHWDRRGKNDENSSCFIRVAQPWVGAQWGAQFTPRVGTEVIVGFEDGRPDMPVILGQVGNGARQPPFDPKNKTRVGFVSSTVGGRGQNQFWFDDARGAETVQLSAQRELRVEVAENHDMRVSGKSSVNVIGELAEDIAGGRKENVGGPRVSSVVGPRTDRTSGTWSHVVKGGILLEASGALEMRGRDDLKIGATHSLTIDVGSKKIPGTLTTYVNGEHVMGATDRLVLRSEATVELTCGASSLVIAPTGVTIRAAKIEVVSEEGISAKSSKGASLALGEDAKISAKKLTCFAEKSSLRLDDKGVNLAGDKINIDAAPEDAKEDPMKDPEEETKPLKVVLSNDAFQPYANKDFHLVVDGRVLQGKTDGDGLVDKKVPKAAKRALVRLWEKDYPTASPLQWELNLMEELPPVQTVHGAKMRLRNLGYYGGAPDDVADESFRTALLEFQRDAGAPPTGQLDPDAIDHLEKYHIS